MRVEIKPGRAAGAITAPPSKSMAHRLLIASALCNGVSHIWGISECADVVATVSCLRALGAEINIDKESGEYTVRGCDIRHSKIDTVLNCNESGSTLRFLIPIATMSGETVKFTGAERLMQRPLSLYREIYEKNGYLFKLSENTLSVSGALPHGEYTVRGDISSQFITGLIFALPLCEGASRIHILPPFESRSYIEMTLLAASEFGIHAKFLDQYTIGIESGRYCPSDISVEGDFSGSAFIEALSLFGGRVTVHGLNESSRQGDKIYRKYFKMLKEGYSEIDISDCPDLGPILFAVAAAMHGGYFTGTERLKIKESDRALAMKDELCKVGINVEILDNAVRVNPGVLHAPSAPIESHNDHRIVMSMAILLTLVGGQIMGAESVAKSYPEFFSDLRALGIEVKEYDT